MTNEEIRLSEWAREVYSEVPDIYEYTIRMVQDPKFTVSVHQSYETGEKVWAIESNTDPGFWLTSRSSKTKAIKLCKEMGWKIENINKDGTY